MGEIGRIIDDVAKIGIVTGTALGAVACAVPAGKPHPVESKQVDVPAYTALYSDLLKKKCGETINPTDHVGVIEEVTVTLAGGTEQTTAAKVSLKKLDAPGSSCPPEPWFDAGPHIPIVPVIH